MARVKPVNYFGSGGGGSYAPLNHNHDSRYALIFHSTGHANGGSDPLKLDALAVPDDSTNLDVSVSAHGLMPKLTGETDKFFRGDGSWSEATIPDNLDMGSFV